MTEFNPFKMFNRKPKATPLTDEDQGPAMTRREFIGLPKKNLADQSGETGETAEEAVPTEEPEDEKGKDITRRDFLKGNF